MKENQEEKKNMRVLKNSEYFSSWSVLLGNFKHHTARHLNAQYCDDDHAGLQSVISYLPNRDPSCWMAEHII